MDEGQALHEGKAGFRKKRSCRDNVYTLNEIVQCRLREGKKTYAFSLDVQKAYDTVWRNGLSDLVSMDPTKKKAERSKLTKCCMTGKLQFFCAFNAPIENKKMKHSCNPYKLMRDVGSAGKSGGWVHSQ